MYWYRKAKKMISKQNMIDKVRALLAKANDEAASEAEAAACAERAAKLMDEYRITRDDVSEEAGDEVVVDAQEVKYFGAWRSFLVTALCKLNCVSPVKVGKTELEFYGSEAAIFVMRETYDHLEQTVLRLAREHSSERRAKLRFEKGCGTRLANRIREMCAEVDEPKTEAGKGLALVRLDEAQRARLKLESDYPSLRKGRASVRGTGSADYAAGRAAGDKIGLHKQTTQSSRGRLLS